MTRRNKPVDPGKESPAFPLLKYRITRHGESPIYVDANEVTVWAEGALCVEIAYTNSYNVTICAFSKDEWEKIELVSAFPEEI